MKRLRCTRHGARRINGIERWFDRETRAVIRDGERLVSEISGPFLRFMDERKRRLHAERSGK